MLSILNKISATHNCCEDSFFVKENDYMIIGGVFDGCSTGINSKWASQTFAYLFGNAWENPVTDYKIKSVRWALQSMAQAFHLMDTMQYLTTCLLFCYEKQAKKLSVRALGDGWYSVNGNEFDIDQNNIPDYLGHHLYDDASAFNTYLEHYKIRQYPDVESFIICSDGINSIQRSQFASETAIEPLARLLHPPLTVNYLERQWNILKRNEFTLSDDLTIISYVKD